MRPLCQEQTNSFVHLIDEARAYDLLRAYRWPAGVRCPYCAAPTPAGPWPNPKVPASWRYQCRTCGKYFTDRTGTIFAGAKLPLSAWLLAAYLVELGQTTAQIARELPCDYHTAQRVVWTIREREIQVEAGWRLSGVIEADEKYQIAGHKGQAPGGGRRVLGRAPRRRGKRPGRGRGSAAKDQPALVALVSRTGEVVVEVVPDVRQDTLKPVFKRTVAPGSVVYTDTAAGYRCLDQAGYQHETVNHSQGEYVRGAVHENRAETVWSLWQPFILPFRGVAQRNLPAYARVFQFRRNHRHLTAFGRVELILAEVVQTARQPARLFVRLVQVVLSWQPGHPVVAPMPI